MYLSNEFHENFEKGDESVSENLLIYLWCFIFYQKMCTLFKKIAILYLFLKNVSPFKRVICFILNNLHFPMVKGITFYALYKSRVLIIPCSRWLWFIDMATRWNFQKSAEDRYPILKLIFSLFCGLTLRKHYIIKATWSVIRNICIQC